MKFDPLPLQKCLMGFGVAALGILSSCATVPAPAPQPTAEKMRQEERQLEYLTNSLEAQLAIRQDMEVSIYLRGLAERLIQGEPGVKGSPIGVWTVKGPPPALRSYALPGNRIYLSVELMQEFQFENELAAALALELAHLIHRHAVNAYEPAINGSKGIPIQDPPKYTTPAQFFGPGGIFDFQENQLMLSIDTAVGILYRAGFDSRGLVSLLKRHGSDIKRSPYDADQIDRLVTRTRQAIAKYAPLRNPVVRSTAFLKVRERIQRL